MKWVVGRAYHRVRNDSWDSSKSVAEDVCDLPQAFPSILFSSTAMDSGSNEATRLWRVYRTAHQMVHDRVGINTTTTT